MKTLERLRDAKEMDLLVSAPCPAETHKLGGPWNPAPRQRQRMHLWDTWAQLLGSFSHRLSLSLRPQRSNMLCYKFTWN